MTFMLQCHVHFINPLQKFVRHIIQKYSKFKIDQLHKRHEYFNQTQDFHFVAAVMNILAKFNHDSTVKSVIVSFSGRKFMKIIDWCRVQFQWLVTAGAGGNYLAAGF